MRLLKDQDAVHLQKGRIIVTTEGSERNSPYPSCLIDRSANAPVKDEGEQEVLDFVRGDA